MGDGRRCELKDHQQYETEGNGISLMPDVDGTHVHVFESLKLEGLYVGDSLDWATPAMNFSVLDI